VIRPTGSFTYGMTVAVRQAGAVAYALQGRVLNEGKDDATSLPGDSEALRQRRAAKTVVDEIVQEILIIAAAELLDCRTTSLDAEEESRSTHLFVNDGSRRTLILDPVDGTVEYIEGLSSYSICAGLVENGRLTSALVFFPARDHLYVLDEAGRSFAAVGAQHNGLEKARPLALGSNSTSRVLYVNGRVPMDVQTCLRGSGFQVIDDTVDGRGAPDCILACMNGEARAYVSHTRQLRDILLGGILAGASGGYACDWQGKELVWPPGGRVARAIFGAGEPPSELLSCLSQATDG
jgi:fructose-1,6-bisphosphatase/inositol monophosphatase family enzyme